MKFLVSDFQEKRHATIRDYLRPECAVIAALLAAVDFEWTVRRVLDHASGGDAAIFGKQQVSGLAGYADAWARIIKGPDANSLQSVVGDWDGLVKAYQLRHDIVHGKQGTSGLSYVTTRVARILAASEAVANFGRQRDANPYKRLRKRGFFTNITITR